jgi:hypothetical protein
MQSKPKNRSTLAVFSSKKSVPANRKTGFYANGDPNKQEVGHFCMKGPQNFEVFSNIQE